MEIVLGILAVLVAALTVLQGISMRKNRKTSNNPVNLTKISGQLSDISAQLGRMGQRLEDIWSKVNK